MVIVLGLPVLRVQLPQLEDKFRIEGDISLGYELRQLASKELFLLLPLLLFFEVDDRVWIRFVPPEPSLLHLVGHQVLEADHGCVKLEPAQSSEVVGNLGSDLLC